MPVATGMEVDTGDIVRTKSDSKVEITLVDASVLRLAEKTRVKIDKYLLEGAERKDGSMTLYRGKVRAVVSKASSGDAPGKFEIHTPTAVAGVRGTDFFVFHQLGVSGIMVTLGKVDVLNPNHPGSNQLVTAGNVVLVKDGERPQLPRPASSVEGDKHDNDTKIGSGEKSSDDGDDEGEGDSGPVTPSFTESMGIEDDAPVLAIDGPDAVTNSSDAEFTITTSEESTFTYNLDGEPVSGTSFSGLGEGEHTFTVTATDIWGNVTVGTHVWRTDYTDPSTEVSSGPDRITDSTSADFVVTTNEDSILEYSLDGAPVPSTSFSGLGQGVHTFNATATDEAGNSSSTEATWFVGAVEDNFVGGASGTGSSFTADSVSGRTVMVTGEGWGSYEIGVSGAYEGPSGDEWNIVAGGRGLDDSTDANEGYWVDQMFGTYSGANMSGAGSLLYLTEEFLGVGAGTVTGSYDEIGGTFEVDDTGFVSYVEVPLGYFADMNPAAYVNGAGVSGAYEITGDISSGRYDYEYLSDNTYGRVHYKSPTADYHTTYYPDGTTYTYNNVTAVATTGAWNPAIDQLSELIKPSAGLYSYERESAGNVSVMSGQLNLYMGGIESLWGAGENVALVLGEYDAYNAEPYIFRNWHGGSGEYPASTFTTADGGAYVGSIIGESRADDGASAIFGGIYIAPDGSAGYLLSDLEGVLYPDISMLELAGLMTATEMATGVELGIAPADLGLNLWSTALDASGLEGSFTDGGDILVADDDGGFGASLSLVNTATGNAEDWGIYGLTLYGAAGAPAPAWSAVMGGYGDFGAHNVTGSPVTGDDAYWIGSITDGTATGGAMSGTFSGRFISETALGEMQGDVNGSYDEGAGSFEIYNVGAWDKTPLAHFSYVEPTYSETDHYYEGFHTYADGATYLARYNNFGYTLFTRPDASYVETNYYSNGVKTEYDSSTGITTTSAWDTGSFDLSSLTTAPVTGSPSTYVSYETVYAPQLHDDMDAHMGGVASLWSGADVPVSVIGEYDNEIYDGGNYPQSVFYDGRINSYNYIVHDHVTYDGGAYVGVMGGTELQDALSARFVGLYIDDAGDAGILSGVFAGAGFEGANAFEMDGVMNRTQMTTAAELGVAPGDLYGRSWWGTMGLGGLDGSFTGGGAIFAGVNGTGDTVSIVNYLTHEGEGWGAFGRTLYGAFDTPTSVWTATLGGEAVFGAYHDGSTFVDNAGYWSAGVADGTFSGGIVDGTLSGSFISRTHVGAISGDLAGTYSADNPANAKWEGVALGAWQGDPVAFWSEVSASLDYYDAFVSDGALNAYMGGADAPFTGSAVPVVLIGAYAPDSANETHIFYEHIISHDNLVGTDTVASGGAYSGVVAGFDAGATGVAGAGVAALYTGDSSGTTAGILLGSLDGTANQATGVIDMTGSLTAIEMESGLSLGALSISTETLSGSTGSGLFDAGGSITPVDSSFEISSVNGASGDWGAFAGYMGGAYSGLTSNGFEATTDYNNYSSTGTMVLSTVTDGATWSGGELSGTTYGYMGDEWITGVVVADTAGTFNPGALSTFQAVTTGAWIEAARYVGMADPLSANYNPDALSALNIPYAEVGRATLAGSGNNLTVSLNDARFYSYSSGAAPKLWATDNITGAYSAAPAIGVAVPISGGGLSADFTVRHWDATTDNSWLSTIDSGSGTLSGGSYSGPVTFEGVGSGSINTGAGTFTGTGAGVAGQ
jgi:hypothetical protein